MSLLDSLVSYWPLNEASGNALDAHGSLHLTETSGTIGAAAGRISGARDFEAGDTEYFGLADNASLSAGDIDFTIACWVNPESVTGFQGIASKGWQSVPDANSEWMLFLSSGAARFLCRGSGTSPQPQASPSLTAGSWYWLMAYHDSVNNQIGISVNNGTVATASHSLGVNDGNREFQIGASTGINFFWDGLICEFGLWKRLLTSDERAQLYNNGNGLAYPFITGARRRRLLLCAGAA